MMQTTLTIAVLISLLFCTSLADSIADDSMQLDAPKAPADAMKDSNRVKDLDQIEAKKVQLSELEQAQESDVKNTSDGVDEQNDENISVGEEPGENTENQKAETEPDTTVQNDKNVTAGEKTEDQKEKTDVDGTLENEDANDENETHGSIKKIAVTENNLEKDETHEAYKLSIQSDPEKETTVLDAVLNNAVDEEPSKIEIDETKSDIPNEESIEFEAESNPETEISVQIQHSDMPDQTQEEVNVHPERTLIPVASNDVNNPIPNHAISTVSTDHGIPAVSHLNEAEASERNYQSFQENETLKQPEQVVSNQANLDASEINPKFQKIIPPPIEANSDQNVDIHNTDTVAPAAPMVLPNDYSQQPQVHEAKMENLDSNALSWEDKPADKPELKLTPEEIDELLKLKQQGRLTEMIDRSHELKQKQTEKELAQNTANYEANLNYNKDQEIENLTFENDDEESNINSNYQQSLLNQNEQSEVKDENPYETEFNEPIETDKSTEHLAESRNYQHLQADTLPKEENLASVTRQKNPYKNIMIAVILLSLGLTWINRRMVAGLFMKRKRRGYSRVQEDEDIQCSFTNIMNRFNDEGGSYVQVDVTPNRVQSPETNGWEEDNWEDWGDEDEKWDETA